MLQNKKETRSNPGTKRFIQKKELEKRLYCLCDKAYNYFFYLKKEFEMNDYEALKEAEILDAKEFWK